MQVEPCATGCPKEVVAGMVGGGERNVTLVMAIWAMADKATDRTRVDNALKLACTYLHGVLRSSSMLGLRDVTWISLFGAPRNFWHAFMPPCGTNYAKWPARKVANGLYIRRVLKQFLSGMLWEHKCWGYTIVFQPFTIFVLFKLLNDEY